MNYVLSFVFFAFFFFIVPIASVAFFVSTLICYRVAKRKSKMDYVSEAKLKTLKTLLIVSSVIMAVLIVCITGIIVTFGIALAYM